MKYSPDEPGLPRAQLYERVRAAIDASPPPGLRTSKQIPLALLGAPLLAALVALIASYVVYGQPAQGLEVDIESIPQLRLVLYTFTTFTLASTYFALSQGRTGFGAGVAILVAIACSITPLYAILILPEPLHASGVLLDAARPSPWGVRCLLVASIVIGLSLSSFALALRRAVTVAVRLRGAALGAAAGAWAGIALLFFCPAGEALHLIVGHVLPILVAIVLGFALTPAVLKT
ncbi:MAG: NrsF family protein [Steroidobacter sp.]